MVAHDLLFVHREQPVRVVLPEIRLVCKRQFLKVIQRPDVLRLYPCRIHFLTVRLYSVIDIADRALQLRELYGFDLISRQSLFLCPYHCVYLLQYAASRQNCYQYTTLLFQVKVLNQFFFPFFFPESDQYFFSVHKDGTLHEHTVRGKEGKLIFLSHIREPVL